MNNVKFYEHGENIHKLIKPKETMEIKPPHYVSIHKNNVIREVNMVKRDHKTLGLAEVALPKPNEYLRKRCGVVPPRPKIDEPRCLITERKPPIPPYPGTKKEHGKEVNKDKPSELKGGIWEENWNRGRGTRCPCPKDGLAKSEEMTRAKKEAQSVVQVEKETPQKTEVPETKEHAKNFVLKNIKNAERSCPRQPISRCVDTERGALQTLIPSGLAPRYIYKKNYGQFPRHCIRNNIEEEEAVLDEANRSNVCLPSNLRYVNQEEKAKILEGLKYNWSVLQGWFQLLPIQCDTAPKLQYKIYLENLLKQLEYDIRVVERYDNLFTMHDE